MRHYVVRMDHSNIGETSVTRVVRSSEQGDSGWRTEVHSTSGDAAPVKSNPGARRNVGLMRQPIRRSAILAALAAAVPACAPTTRDLPQATELGSGVGYRPINMARPPGLGVAIPGAYVLLAFSGGGTRATALSHGVLRELEATPVPSGVSDLTLLDTVDMISSVSGGSVAAANYVVNGRAGYRRIEGKDGFLRHNGIADLLTGALNPVNAAYYLTTSASRIELLSTMFERTVVGRATFQNLQDRAPERRPFLVLNAADMATGQRFPFTQHQLDLLCLDLRKVRVADAVAASAAFPVALTPLPLPNHSPCPAQRIEAGSSAVEWVLDEAGPGRAGLAAACGDQATTLDLQPRAARSRGLRQSPLLNLDPCGRELAPNDPRRVRFVHLLDGGTADNLGLDGPLETLTSGGDDPRVKRAMGTGQVRRVFVVAVNARSQRAPSVGRNGATPGLWSMLNATIDASIDARSGGLLAQLETLPALMREKLGKGAPEVTVLPVDFELIQDAECRAKFQGIGTTWSLSGTEVDALQEMASAMLRSSPAYLALMRLPPSDTVYGQRRAAQACARLLGRPDAPAGPPAFGAPAQVLTLRPASSLG